MRKRRENENAPASRVVRAATNGDRGALEALWNTHRVWVGAIVEAVRPREVELEDLLQEVALRFVRQISTLRDPSVLRPWLRRIARNVCTDAARRSQLRRSEPAQLETLEIMPGHPGTAREIESRDELERIHDALASLPESTRELLALRAIDGLTQRELAETYAVPETTIESRLVRARRALREALDTNTTTPSLRRCLR